MGKHLRAIFLLLLLNAPLSHAFSPLKCLLNLLASDKNHRPPTEADIQKYKYDVAIKRADESIAKLKLISKGSMHHPQAKSEIAKLEQFKKALTIKRKDPSKEVYVLVNDHLLVPVTDNLQIGLAAAKSGEIQTAAFTGSVFNYSTERSRSHATSSELGAISLEEYSSSNSGSVDHLKILEKPADVQRQKDSLDKQRLATFEAAKTELAASRERVKSSTPAARVLTSDEAMRNGVVVYYKGEAYFPIYFDRVDFNKEGHLAVFMKAPSHETNGKPTIYHLTETDLNNAKVEILTNSTLPKIKNKVKLASGKTVLVDGQVHTTLSEIKLNSDDELYYLIAKNETEDELQWVQASKADVLGMNTHSLSPDNVTNPKLKKYYDLMLQSRGPEAVVALDKKGNLVQLHGFQANADQSKVFVNYVTANGDELSANIDDFNVDEMFLYNQARRRRSYFGEEPLPNSFANQVYGTKPSTQVNFVHSLGDGNINLVTSGTFVAGPSVTIADEWSVLVKEPNGKLRQVKFDNSIKDLSTGHHIGETASWEMLDATNRLSPQLKQKMTLLRPGKALELNDASIVIIDKVSYSANGSEVTGWVKNPSSSNYEQKTFSLKLEDIKSQAKNISEAPKGVSAHFVRALHQDTTKNEANRFLFEGNDGVKYFATQVFDDGITPRVVLKEAYGDKITLISLSELNELKSFTSDKAEVNQALTDMSIPKSDQISLTKVASNQHLLSYRTSSQAPYKSIRAVSVLKDVATNEVIVTGLDPHTNAPTSFKIEPNMSFVFGSLAEQSSRVAKEYEMPWPRIGSSETLFVSTESGKHIVRNMAEKEDGVDITFIGPSGIEQKTLIPRKEMSMRSGKFEFVGEAEVETHVANLRAQMKQGERKPTTSTISFEVDPEGRLYETSRQGRGPELVGDDLTTAQKTLADSSNDTASQIGKIQSLRAAVSAQSTRRITLKSQESIEAKILSIFVNDGKLKIIVQDQSGLSNIDLDQIESVSSRI